MALTVAAIQFDIQWNAPAANTAIAAPLVAAAAKAGAKFVVLPEMFTCGFSLCVGEQAAEASTIGEQFLVDMAKRHQIWCAGSIPTASTTAGFEHPHNTIVITSPNGVALRYSKTHLFSFGNEQQLYTAGSSYPQTVNIEGVRVTPVICYDIRFPYLFQRCATETDLFVVVANWPVTRQLHWETLTRARAIENQAALVAVNRTGTGGGLTYVGGSVGYNHLGVTQMTLGEQAGIGTFTVDANEIQQWRAQFPALRDRREEQLRTDKAPL